MPEAVVRFSGTCSTHQRQNSNGERITVLTVPTLPKPQPLNPNSTVTEWLRVEIRGRDLCFSFMVMGKKGG